MTLDTHQQDWEELAGIDPLWAILSASDRQFGQWDLGDFFRTGEEEIQAVMERAAAVGYPEGRDTALDFGCGVGRLTRALAGYFRRCYGIDISERMISEAGRLNCHLPNCKFIVHADERLPMFRDDQFDMIYTNIVLMHQPRRQIIRSYIAEFVRTLKVNGLLVFQLASYIHPLNRLQPRRRLYSLLRRLGLSESFVYNRLRLFPIRLNFIPERDVLIFLRTVGATVLEVAADGHAGPSNQSRTYYVTKQRGGSPSRRSLFSRFD